MAELLEAVSRGVWCLRHPALGTADGMRSLDAQRPCGLHNLHARPRSSWERRRGESQVRSVSNPDVVFFQVHPTCRGDGNRGGRRGGGFFSARSSVLRGGSVAKPTVRAGGWGWALIRSVAGIAAGRGRGLGPRTYRTCAQLGAGEPACRSGFAVYCRTTADGAPA